MLTVELLRTKFFTATSPCMTPHARIVTKQARICALTSADGCAALCVTQRLAGVARGKQHNRAVEHAQAAPKRWHHHALQRTKPAARLLLAPFGRHNNAYVPVLVPEALAAASLHVRTLDASALQQDASADDHDLVVLLGGRVHALYAVHMLLRALAYGPLQDVALARIMELLARSRTRPASPRTSATKMALWVENEKDSPDAVKWQGLLPAMKRVHELVVVSWGRLGATSTQRRSAKKESF